MVSSTYSRLAMFQRYSCKSLKREQALTQHQKSVFRVTFIHIEDVTKLDSKRQQTKLKVIKVVPMQKSTPRLVSVVYA